jgi:hypothetical protein
MRGERGFENFNSWFGWKQTPKGMVDVFLLAGVVSV